MMRLWGDDGTTRSAEKPHLITADTALETVLTPSATFSLPYRMFETLHPTVDSRGDECQAVEWTRVGVHNTQAVRTMREEVVEY